MNVNVVDIVKNGYYKLIGQISRGQLKGAPCYLSYKGDPEIIREKEIIARCDMKRKKGEYF